MDDYTDYTDREIEDAMRFCWIFGLPLIHDPREIQAESFFDVRA